MNVRVAGVLRRGQTILTLKYHYADGDVFALPGGGVEEYERCETALKREFREEVGLDVDVDSLLYTGDMMATGKRKRTLHLIFLVQGCDQDVPQLNKAETTANDLIWLPQHELSQVLLYPDIGQSLRKDLEGSPKARHLGDCMQRKWA